MVINIKLWRIPYEQTAVYSSRYRGLAWFLSNITYSWHIEQSVSSSFGLDSLPGVWNEWKKLKLILRFLLHQENRTVCREKEIYAAQAPMNYDWYIDSVILRTSMESNPFWEFHLVRSFFTTDSELPIATNVTSNFPNWNMRKKMKSFLSFKKCFLIVMKQLKHLVFFSNTCDNSMHCVNWIECM